MYNVAQEGDKTNIDPSTTKYLIKAQIQADGVIEKPDVVGAIFGQTEGLLGNELDLRDLQKSGRIGRIEVDVDSKRGKSTGVITLPSSLDKVETAIMAAALESIDRVGPCRAEIKVLSIDDVRVTKRRQVADRAKQLLHSIVDGAKDDTSDLMEDVRAAVRTEELISYGPEKSPAGPNILKSDAILIVEGRNDVLNLLKNGIKNAVAVEGTNVPKSVVELSRERVATAFVDGDRGGDLILKELLQTAEVDFVARAPRGREVEELTQKQIMKCLRNKIPADQYVEMFKIEGVAPRTTEKSQKFQGRGPPPGRGERRDERDDRGRDRPERMGRPERQERPAWSEPEPAFEESRGVEAMAESTGAPEPGEDADDSAWTAEEPEKPTGARETNYLSVLNTLSGKLQAVVYDDAGVQVGEPIAVRDLADSLKRQTASIKAVVFDGVVTQRLLDIAAEKNISTLVGVKTGNITKRPASVEVVTKADLE
ncbi:MAG: DNA primase [Euryarchaeota archaeon]|nr:DNA primase [Euryarchaeota archaeon]